MRRRAMITERQDIANKIKMISDYIKIKVIKFNYVTGGYYFVVDSEVDAYNAATYFWFNAKVEIELITSGWRVSIFDLTDEGEK